MEIHGSDQIEKSGRLVFVDHRRFVDGQDQFRQSVFKSRKIVAYSGLTRIFADEKILIGKSPVGRVAEDGRRCIEWLVGAASRHGQPASVSQFVRRFRLAGEDRKKEFRDVLSKVTS